MRRNPCHLLADALAHRGLHRDADEMRRIAEDPTQAVEDQCMAEVLRLTDEDGGVRLSGLVPIRSRPIRGKVRISPS